jgi:hypothetical protein
MMSPPPSRARGRHIFFSSPLRKRGMEGDFNNKGGFQKKIEKGILGTNELLIIIKSPLPPLC